MEQQKPRVLSEKRSKSPCSKKVEGALHEKWAYTLFSVQPLCALCLCGSLLLRKNNHRGTEHTEVAQRRSRIETFRAKPVRALAMLKRLSLLILAFALQASWFRSSAFGQNTLPVTNQAPT